MSVAAVSVASSAPPIDVLIPAIEKDLATLPYVIDSLRRYVQHSISNIYIVSPENSRIRQLCSRKACVFVNETTVLPFTKKRSAIPPPAGTGQAGCISSCSR